ncbi:MAG: hypothetical protein ACYC92_06540 [Candidatus Acidiferrales bacterium]
MAAATAVNLRQPFIGRDPRITALANYGLCDGDWSKAEIVWLAGVSAGDWVSCYGNIGVL